MRILLDECAPRPLKRELTDYKISTVTEMGWSGQKNGALLSLMNQEGFTVLLTTDQNLRYQQDLEKMNIAVIVMIASTNRLADLVPLIPDVRKVLTMILPGQVVEVGGD